LKLFNFQSLTLDAALRKFLKQFQLVGDAQEKERVLLYFAKRYVDANNTAFTDVGESYLLLLINKLFDYVTLIFDSF
jgi:Sec7-like guanine-nucleotide exchange factor